MPSKRDPCLVAQPQPQQQQHQPSQQPQPQQQPRGEADDDAERRRRVLARDVDQLVSEIKENLRLKARPNGGGRRQARPTPYPVERGAARQAAKEKDSANNNNKEGVEDPYEILQQLLDTNSLVAEAVRRLRDGFSNKKSFLYEDEDYDVVAIHKY